MHVKAHEGVLQCEPSPMRGSQMTEQASSHKRTDAEVSIELQDRAIHISSCGVVPTYLSLRMTLPPPHCEPTCTYPRPDILEESCGLVLKLVHRGESHLSPLWMEISSPALLRDR